MADNETGQHIRRRAGSSVRGVGITGCVCARGPRRALCAMLLAALLGLAGCSGKTSDKQSASTQDEVATGTANTHRTDPGSDASAPTTHAPQRRGQHATLGRLTPENIKSSLLDNGYQATSVERHTLDAAWQGKYAGQMDVRLANYLLRDDTDEFVVHTASIDDAMFGLLVFCRSKPGADTSPEARKLRVMRMMAPLFLIDDKEVKEAAGASILETGRRPGQVPPKTVNGFRVAPEVQADPAEPLVALRILPAVEEAGSLAHGPTASRGDPPTTDSRLPIASIATSSEKQPWRDYTFFARNLIDGDLATSWQPRHTSQSGRGEWLEIRLAGEAAVSAIEIANGFQTEDGFGDEFTLNSRIRSATVTLDDGTTVPISFGEAARGWSRFDLGGRRARSLKIVVGAVFRGSKWDDLAVSEIAVEGHATGSVASDAAAASPGGSTADLASYLKSKLGGGSCNRFCTLAGLSPSGPSKSDFDECMRMVSPRQPMPPPPGWCQEQLDELATTLVGDWLNTKGLIDKHLGPK